MAEEIIKTTVEIALSGICVYAGAAIYNWGYRNGLKVMDKKIIELEERNRHQRAKINELTKLRDIEHFNAPVKCKEMWVNGKKIK